MPREDLQETKRLCIGAVAVDEAPDDLICSYESSLAMKAATPEVIKSKWIEINTRWLRAVCLATLRPATSKALDEGV